MIGAVVLAAGRGERFGGDKVLAEVRGIALVRHVVDRLRLAGLAPVVVVAGPSPDGVRSALVGTDAQVVANPDPSSGMSGSLGLGVSALPVEVDAFVVALGDQPFIEASVVRSLGETWRDSNAAAVVPMYHDGRGNPVLFDASMRRRLQALEGDMGARDLLAAMGDRVLRVPVDGDAPRDVDTPDDLQALGG
ncbi:MAG TPA: nucleotidyltransferase family protein [Gemmatimonadaceae bacterium]|nr:nucleotidyltransferase family protein [Gemmatimonadaceae bacterium]